MLWVVVPAFNEAENLVEVVPAIAKVIAELGEESRLLVVNDGSTDSTAAVLGCLVREHDNVQALHIGRNVGKASALQRGFEAALDQGATEIAMMDADGQDDPTELGALLDAVRDGADLVTGARIQRNDRLVKRSTSRLYNGVTRRMSGAPGQDFNSGFKMLRAQVARDLAPMMYGELHRYLTILAHARGYRVLDVPVTHHPRLHGRSKYGIARFWRGFFDLITIRFLMSYQNRPSHLFGGTGFVSLLVGGLVLTYLTVVKLGGEPIGGRPLLIGGVLFVVVGVQLILFGLLAELIVHARNTQIRVWRS